MTHQNDSPRRIDAQHWVNTLCAVCALVLLSLTRTEAHASGMFPSGGGNRAVLSAPETSAWDASKPLLEETEKHDTRSSLPERPGDIVPAVTAPRHEPAADTGISSPWIDRDTARLNFTLSLQAVSDSGPLQLNAATVDLESRSPVVPVSAPPSSGLLFVTALVGMLGTVFRGDSLIEKARRTNTLKPHRPCSTRLVVVLSPDAVFAGDLAEQLHRAGYAVRGAAAVSELLVVTDPASLSLVLVDHRIPDWDTLRTDPSLRHVLLMAVVPTGCLYTDDHYISDLERGIDGVHDLRDGHRLLVAKIGAYLRRSGCASARRGVYQVGAVTLDGDAHEVTIAGRQVKLTAKPFAILRALMREPSKAFSRSELVNVVWGSDFAVSSHALDVHVHVLRQQLDREPNCLCELLTIPHVGFKLKPLASARSIRTSRPRSTSNSISDSHACSRKMPRLISGRITPPNRRFLSGQPLKPPVNTCITSPCG